MKPIFRAVWLWVAFLGVTVVLIFPSIVSTFHSNIGNIDLARALSRSDNRAVENPLATARHHFEAATRWNNCDVRALVGLGKLYSVQGDNGAAIQALRKAIQWEPENILAHFWLGNLYEVQGQRSDAIAEWRWAGAGPYFLTQGKYYWVKRQFDVAELQYDLAMEVGLSSVNLLYNAGDLYKDLGRWDKAIHAYNAAIALEDDRSAKKYLTLGWIYYAQHSWDEAIQAYEEALKRAPRSEWAYYGIGLVLYQGKHDIPGAIGQWQKAIELNPRFLEAYMWIGHVYMEQKEFDEALHWYSQAAAIEPTNDWPQSFVGLVFFEQGRLEEATEQFEAIIARNPQTAPVHYWLGRTYWRRGQLDQAAEELQEAINYERAIQSKLTYIIALGDLYCAQQNYGGAMSEYQRALQLDPQNAYVKQQLERCSK
jgi:tetratricopeptide (TPR) repeat protein